MVNLPIQTPKRISTTCSSTSLGELLIGATEKGICLVALLDSRKDLSATLQELGLHSAESMNAHLARTCTRALKLRIEGEASALDFSLDLNPTAFQARVWNRLQMIATGATITYSELAESIGRPKAARAVASACAANPVCLLIPCHRVVSKGSDGGYRWGAWRKKELLARESATLATRESAVLAARESAALVGSNGPPI